MASHWLSIDKMSKVIRERSIFSFTATTRRSVTVRGRPLPSDHRTCGCLPRFVQDAVSAVRKGVSNGMKLFVAAFPSLHHTNHQLTLTCKSSVDSPSLPLLLFISSLAKSSFVHLHYTNYWLALCSPTATYYLSPSSST